MVVKNQIKFIKSLQQKKYRNQHGLFVAEGVKLVSELLNSRLSLAFLYSADNNFIPAKNIKVQKISESDLKRISSLKTPNKVLAVFEIPSPKPIDFSNWILALDRVQDPGNLGTIIRLADWFGIGQLLCSPDTVDCYNPKTLQATMGSIARVNVLYDDVGSIVKKSGLPTFGAYMKGKVVYGQKFPEAGILVMGNESHGISETLEKLMDHKICIPQFGNSEIESLNVATATAILLNELRRPLIQR